MQVTDKRQPGWYRRSRKKLLSLLITDVVSRDKGFFFDECDARTREW